MRAWIVQVGEPLPIDEGHPRLWRSGQLARALAEAGHEVTWWASTFEHRTKQQRDWAPRESVLAPNWRLRLLDSPGYDSNVSLARMKDHVALARAFDHAVTSEPRPDVIHCGYPTIELAGSCAAYGRRQGVPVVLDVRDFWPEIFADAVPAWLRPVARLALLPQMRRSARAFQLATAVSGITPGQVAYGVTKARRSTGPLDVAFPFAYPRTAHPSDQLHVAAQFWRTQGITPGDGVPTLCYFGNFGAHSALDLVTPVRAVRQLVDSGFAVRLVMCGTGPRLDECRAAAGGSDAVVFPGWVGEPAIWWLMQQCVAGLLPYAPAPNFTLNIPNKVGEFMAGGLPVLTCLRGGYLEEVLRTHRCGVFYDPYDPTSAADAVRALVTDTEATARLAAAAGRLYSTMFAPAVVMAAMTSHLESLVAATVRPPV
jgi:glycosyltransferase involved in cell wall biosynthesis